MVLSPAQVSRVGLGLTQTCSLFSPHLSHHLRVQWPSPWRTPEIIPPLSNMPISTPAPTCPQTRLDPLLGQSALCSLPPSPSPPPMGARWCVPTWYSPPFALFNKNGQLCRHSSVVNTDLAFPGLQCPPVIGCFSPSSVALAKVQGR